MLQEFGLVQIDTPIVTTVHPLQIVEDLRLPMQAHDWALNWIVTAEEVIETNTSYPRSIGLNWIVYGRNSWNKFQFCES